MQQLLTRQDGQGLPRIEDKGHTGLGEPCDMTQHAVPAIRRDDAQRGAGRISHLVQVRMHHRTRVEGSDLVIVEIRRNEGLCGIGTRHGQHMILTQAQIIETLSVGPSIITDGGHDQRVSAQQMKVVSDIPGTATKFTPQIRYQKGDIQDVDLLGQDMVLETVVKNHDGVVSHRTTDKNGHDCPCKGLNPAL
ncbi:hypothetical protein SDC9_184376 [bioreactor metagenome]|uniref:Uncharacterized protein n=1 Tax=bioreactor metagenome TaxID=1076179 RepID=A0A645HL39_9ZZZZ